MALSPGDHICAIYSSDSELAAVVGEFLADGLRKSERCWYLPASGGADRVRAALDERGVDTIRAIDRGALSILSSRDAYTVRGDFDPEATLATFSSAIEQALNDGFSGFRAAADMSWALNFDNGVERLITYEALLRSLFASARATGLCLYDRSRMPLDVIDGALSTHPIVRAGSGYRTNPYYDAAVDSLHAVDAGVVASKLRQLTAAPAESHRHPRGRTRQAKSRAS